MRDGVDPEFAALRANDLAAYHAIADTKISPMFVAYDNAASAVIKALQQKRRGSAGERAIEHFADDDADHRASPCSRC